MSNAGQQKIDLAGMLAHQVRTEQQRKKTECRDEPRKQYRQPEVARSVLFRDAIPGKFGVVHRDAQEIDHSSELGGFLASAHHQKRDGRHRHEAA